MPPDSSQLGSPQDKPQEKKKARKFIPLQVSKFWLPTSILYLLFRVCRQLPFVFCHESFSCNQWERGWSRLMTPNQDVFYLSLENPCLKKKPKNKKKTNKTEQKTYFGVSLFWPAFQSWRWFSFTNSYLVVLLLNLVTGFTSCSFSTYLQFLSRL